MPSGGQISAGSGIRLQAQTPGVTDNGNAHISGQLIAIGFDTRDRLKSPTGNPNNLLIGQDVILGYDSTDPPFYGANNVIVGDYSTVGVNGSGGSGQRGQNNTGIGSSVTMPGWGGVAFGYKASAGIVIGDNYNIAIGFQSIASGSSICMGVSSASNTGPNSILFGTTNNASNNRANCILMGSVTNNNATNLIALKPNGKVFSAADSNSVQIGDASHTLVQIGPYTIGQSLGATRLLIDENPTVTVADGTLIYTAITGARIVQLPAANSVPIGYRLLVSDGSGLASGLNTITIQAAGSDTINAGVTTVINSAFGCREIVSDGASKWIIIRSI